MIDYDSVPIINIFPNRKGKFSIRKSGSEILLFETDLTAWMTADENNSLTHKQMYSSYDLAYGDVLITGLGFGIIATWVYTKPGVKSVTVWEKNKEVIDMFVEANPEWATKLKIEQRDCNTYSTEEDFDCILADHFEYLDDEQTISTIKNLAKNVPNHKLMWFWSLEKIYVSKQYGLNNKNAAVRPLGKYIRNNSINFSSKWNDFLNDSFENVKIAKCDPEKINEYVYIYFDPSQTPKLFIS